MFIFFENSYICQGLYLHSYLLVTFISFTKLQRILSVKSIQSCTIVVYTICLNYNSNYCCKPAHNCVQYFFTFLIIGLYNSVIIIYKITVTFHNESTHPTDSCFQGTSCENLMMYGGLYQHMLVVFVFVSIIMLFNMPSASPSE